MAKFQEGQKDQARQWYDRAVETMEQDHSQDHELRRFRVEAGALLGVADSPRSTGRKEEPESRSLKP